ncbi:MAG: molybdopterin-dependent oxidoreductase [Myxococcota bacterium]
MKRRQLLQALGVSAAAWPLAGCDRLVLLDRVEGGVLTPITPIGQFYVYQVREPPSFDPEAHAMTLRLDDEVLREITPADLATLTPRDVELTLQCIGHSPSVVRIGNAVWGGLPLREVVEQLGVAVPEAAVGLRLVGMDDYDAGVPIEAPLWLAWRMNGEPLPFDHGAPARMLAPGRYGVKWIKWVREIAYVTTPHESFWTPLGWDEEAFNQPNTLVVMPLDGERLMPGERIAFVGAAFSGDDPVVSIEASVDGGPWAPAQIDYAAGPNVWAIWSWFWEAEPGEHDIQVRAMTKSGRETSPNPLGEDVFRGYDGSMQIRITV